jgi:hypothetical protein
MSKQNEHKERKKYRQSDQPAWKPGGVQLHHNHEKILFLTVLFLFAQFKMRYW